MNDVAPRDEEPLTLSAAVASLRASTSYQWTIRRLLSTIVHRQISLYAFENSDDAPAKLVELRAAEAEALLLGSGRNGRFLERGQITFIDRHGAFTPLSMRRLADIRVLPAAVDDVEHVWTLGKKGLATAHDLPPWINKYFLSAQI